MYLYRSALGWGVQAPAKLNLFFEVLARRDDGYHEIESLVYPISLYDTLFFNEEPSGQIRLVCHGASGVWGAGGSEFGEVPFGPENLVVRGVELLRRRAGVSSGAALRLVKRIPSAAGLGGGSSDAAAALAVANAAWKLGWSAARLGQLGAELSSDVPSFFAAGPAICRGRGEHVEPVPGAAAFHFVVVRPPAGLSTAEVYQACRPASPARRVTALANALVQGDVAATGRLLFNRLESVARELTPWIDRLQRELERMDCLGHGMSGSGTCYFGLCRHAGHARRVARRLQAAGVGISFPVRGSR